MTEPKGMGGLNLMDFESFNLSLLARQAWRILQNPNTLSARILKSIHYRTSPSPFLESPVRNHPYQIWRVVSVGKDIIKQGIGNMRDTEILSCNWLPRKEMIHSYGCLASDPPQWS